MKASKILQEYAEGRKDFQNLNLRGQSFRGQNLSGADFSGCDLSECDLRGTNFKKAILKKTKFCQAKAGLQKRWVVILLLVAFIGAYFSRLLTFLLAGTVVGLFSQSINEYGNSYIAGLSTLFVVIVILVATILKGIVSGFITGAVSGVIVSTIALWINPSVLFLTIGTSASSVALTLAIVGITSTSTSAFCSIIGVFGGIVGIIIAASLILNGLFDAFQFQSFPGIMAAMIPLITVLVGGYLGYYGLYTKRNIWIYSFSIAFAATGGTSFYGADLTNADFTEATLKSTDFREAILKRTCWRKTKKIDRIRPGKTILANESVRDLMVTGKGENQSYQGANLNGANLNGVNLNYANLSKADLSEATLEEAELEYANLTEVNAVETKILIFKEMKT